jgi:hypothetical protein
MAKPTQRFAVGSLDGLRSSEWVVFWSTKTSDVYIATRALGGVFKASIHESGQCHIKAPNVENWLEPAEYKKTVEIWSIDPKAAYAFPFAIIFPEQQLRSGEWSKHREKGTVWLACKEFQSIEVGFFLVRSDADPVQSLVTAGWSRILVSEILPDGRRLLVAAGHPAHPLNSAHLAAAADVRTSGRSVIARSGKVYVNPRAILVARDDIGTRRFVEIAV